MRNFRGATFSQGLAVNPQNHENVAPQNLALYSTPKAAIAQLKPVPVAHEPTEGGQGSLNVCEHVLDKVLSVTMTLKESGNPTAVHSHLNVAAACIHVCQQSGAHGLSQTLVSDPST